MCHFGISFFSAALCARDTSGTASAHPLQPQSCLRAINSILPAHRGHNSGPRGRATAVAPRPNPFSTNTCWLKNPKERRQAGSGLMHQLTTICSFFPVEFSAELHGFINTNTVCTQLSIFIFFAAQPGTGVGDSDGQRGCSLHKGFVAL